jgi:hypothetical protein
MLTPSVLNLTSARTTWLVSSRLVMIGMTFRVSRLSLNSSVSMLLQGNYFGVTFRIAIYGLFEPTLDYPEYKQRG